MFIMPLAMLSIVATIILMNVLPYKGWNIIIVSFICAIIVALCNALPLQAATGILTGGVGAMLGTLIGLFVFGAILGEIYNASNASFTLARAIVAPFKNAKSSVVRLIGTIVLLLIVRAVLGIAGFNNIAIMPLMISIIVMVFNACDIPRKYVNCALLIAGEIQILVPGVPSTELVLVEEYLDGFTRTSCFGIRLAILIVYIVAAALILGHLIRKDREKGLHFEPGRMMVPDIHTDVRRPHLILTLIPLAVIFVLYTILGMDAWVVMLISCAVALLCLGWYIPKREGESKYRTLLNCVNGGAFKLPLAICGCMFYGMVLTATPGWEIIQGALSNLPIPPAILFTVASIILVFAGGTQGMIPVMATLALSVCIPNGMSVGICGVIMIMSFVCLDTVPNNIGLIMQCELTDTTIKEAYPAVFRTTVLLTLGMTAIVMLLAMFGVFA